MLVDGYLASPAWLRKDDSACTLTLNPKAVDHASQHKLGFVVSYKKGSKVSKTVYKEIEFLTLKFPHLGDSKNFASDFPSFKAPGLAT